MEERKVERVLERDQKMEKQKKVIKGYKKPTKNGEERNTYQS